MVPDLLSNWLIIVPILMILSGFIGVDAFLDMTGLAIVGLAGGSIGYSLELHDFTVFNQPITTHAVLFVAGLLGLPIAKWREEKKVGIR